MRKMVKIKKAALVALLSGWLLMPNSAQAFVWPKVDGSAISNIITSVTTGLGKITSVQAQIQGYIETIQSIGDQVSMVAKYVSDIKQTITVIKDSVKQVEDAVKRAKDCLKDTIDTVKNEVNKVRGEKSQTAENTVKEVENNIDSESEDELLETVQQAKEETVERDREIEEMLKNTSAQISMALDESEQSVNNVIENINKTEELEEKTKNELTQEANQIKNEIDALRTTATDVLSEISKQYSEESAKIISAYDEYSKAISNYYSKEITKEELVKAGEKLKRIIAESDYDIDKEKINSLVESAEIIIDKTQKFQEEVLNKMANNKEYSDEDDDEKPSQTLGNSKLDASKPRAATEKKIIKNSDNNKYVFNYHSTKEQVYLKGIYADIDKSFLMPAELKCNNLDIKNLATNTATLRDCLTRAKTEKDYFIANHLNGCTDENCDPYKNALYADYKFKGVYNHIYTDYSAAGVANVNEMKQWSFDWQDPTKGVIKELGEKIGKIKADATNSEAGENTKDAYLLLEQLELEGPKIWSRIRKTDALHRATKAVNYFRAADALYLDGRDEDVRDAISNQPGRIDDSDVFPNMMLHNCGMDAADISVESGGTAETAEKNVVNCMKKYVRAVDTGRTDESSENLDSVKQEWVEKEIKAATDSEFNNFTISTINLYKSSQDYVSNTGDGSDNIVTLQEGIKNANDALSAYAAGTKIAFYTTNQILSIVDADAVELQTEIIKSLREMSYNYFDVSDGGAD